MDPFQVVRDFEEALAEYCGAMYAVAVDSCTNALLLCCALRVPRDQWVEIPRFTYIGVPMSILHAGGKVIFRSEQWSGLYELRPWGIWDSARRLRRGIMKEFSNGALICLSFHWAKTLSIGRGGAILTNDLADADWLRRARYDGRTEGVAPKDDHFRHPGWHFYMTPEQAAAGLVRLRLLPDDNPDLPWDDYADLSKIPLFRLPPARLDGIWPDVEITEGNIYGKRRETLG